MSYSLEDVISSRLGCTHSKKYYINFQLGFDHTIRTQCGICGLDITHLIENTSVESTDYAWVSEGRVDEI